MSIQDNIVPNTRTKKEFLEKASLDASLSIREKLMNELLEEKEK